MKYKRTILNIINYFKVFGKPKIFCISMQRSGTTSVGEFFKNHGCIVADSSKSDDWTHFWLKGDYQKIFSSVYFRSCQVFKDNPWWMPDFYRYLNCRFKKAKFILLYRDSDAWYDSMKNHHRIQQLVNTYSHNKIYKKLDLYFDKIDNDPNFISDAISEDNKLFSDEYKNRYINAYEEYNRDAIEYFKKYAPEKLFYASLDDKDKWIKLGKFLDIKVDPNFNVHLNSTKKE